MSMLFYFVLKSTTLQFYYPIKTIPTIKQQTTNYKKVVHPKSYDMLQYAVDNSKTKVTLTTNGTLLNEKRMNKLLKTGLHMIDVSVDAFEAKTYSKIRVGGDLEITQKNIFKLIEMNKANNQPSNNSKIHRPNIKPSSTYNF